MNANFIESCDSFERHLERQAYLRKVRRENEFLGTLDWTREEIDTYNERILGINQRLGAVIARKL